VKRAALAIAERQLANMYYASGAVFGRNEAGARRWMALRACLRLELDLDRAKGGGLTTLESLMAPDEFDHLVRVTAAALARAEGNRGE
jgi:hypothetical protein